MPRRASFSSFRPVLAAALLAVAACTDRNPAAAPEPPSPRDPSAAVLRCDVDVRAGTLACRPMGARTAPGVSAAILGGQGTNVRLASSGTSYDAGTAILRSDVTVENLTGQALGTNDGTTAAPEGVRVFFHSGPQVTGGTGTVTVANADGTAAFTGTDQPYFQYAAPLAPGATSEPKEWRFSVPGTVSTFAFTVYVAAPVRSEAGFVEMIPLAPSLVVGGTVGMGAIVRGVTGNELTGQPVAWASSNPSVATVDSAGVVTGVAVGTATITATSGGRTGSVTVNVAASASTSLPQVVSFSVSPASVIADGADSVTFQLHLTDAVGISSGRVSLANPSGGTAGVCTFSAANRVTGTQFNGVFVCRGAFAAGSTDGAWRVMRLDIVGQGNRTRAVLTADLLAAGAQTHVDVVGGTEDTTAPTLDGFTFSPADTAVIGEDTLVVDMTVGDAGVGLSQATAYFGSLDGSQRTACTVFIPFGERRASGTLRCRIPLRSAFQTLAPGEMRVDSVRVRDGNGNTLVATTADLQTAGYPNRVILVAETTPPALTAFSFSPDSVAANEVDSVTVTATATDPGSGVWLVEATFSKVGGTPDQTRECTGIGSATPSRTASCAMRFGAADAGTWRVDEVAAHDNAGNTLTLTTAQLQSAGYATDLTVTAP